MTVCGFNYVDEFVEAIMCEASEVSHVCVYGFKEDIAPLIGQLLFLGDFTIAYMEVTSPEVDGYNAEYCLSICDGEMYVEKIYDVDNDRYLFGECDVAYIHEDCNSKLLKSISAHTYKEYRVVELDGEDEAFSEQPNDEDGKSEEQEKDLSFKNIFTGELDFDILFELWKKEIEKECKEELKKLAFIKDV